LALVATVIGKRKFLNGFDLIVGLVISGSYPANGEPLDLSLLAPLTSKQPRHVIVTCLNAGVQFTYDKTQKTLRCFTNSAGGANGQLTEHTVAAYAGTIAADTQIELTASFI
jgi:hypothetical protein